MSDDWTYEIKRGARHPRYMASVYRPSVIGYSKIKYEEAFFTRRGAKRWMKRLVKQSRPFVSVESGVLKKGGAR